MFSRAGNRTLASLLALVAATVTGCSAMSANTAAPAESPRPRHGSIGPDSDLAGVRFTVGSKEFTEQVVLGKIMIHALRAAGAQVTDQTGLSGSTIARNALQSRQIDMYWEYSGTGWSQFLGHDNPIPGEIEQYRATAGEDSRNGIAWLGPARFGTQYAIARAADAPGPAGRIDSLGQLRGLVARYPDQASLCGASEFLDRELEPFQRAYGFRFPETQVHQNAFALNYVNVAKASPCTFAEVFTTDARLESLDLRVLRDEKTQFSTQLAALTTRSELVRAHPEVGELARRIGQELTEETMVELNGMVDLHGASPDRAALHFLNSRSFI